MTQITILLLAIVAANLPWLSDKLFYLIPLKKLPKNLAWCLLELVVIYFVLGMITQYAEYSIYGVNATQGWEFYAVTFSLFLVFAFPGFVYKIFWKQQ